MDFVFENVKIDGGSEHAGATDFVAAVFGLLRRAGCPDTDGGGVQSTNIGRANP